MAEDQGTTPTPQPQQRVPPNADPPNKDDGDLGDPGKRALAAEREAAKTARTEAAELRAKLKEFTDRDKTESEKATERATAAEQRAAAAEAKALRFEVADAEGIKPAHRKYLSGATAAELKASARDIKTDFPELYRETPAPPGTRRPPVENLRPGQQGPDGGAPVDNNAWFRSLMRPGH